MNDFKIILTPSITPIFDDQIQISINKCLERGGGEIILTPGLYRSKPIKLISNLKILFQHGSIIQFSDDFSDYSPIFTRWEGTECNALQSMIFAENCSNVELTGNGIIDGLGNKWWKEYIQLRDGNITDTVQKVQQLLHPLNNNIKFGSGGGGIETNFLRPSLIQFKNCNSSKIKGLTLKDSPFWNTHILYCRDMELTELNFINPPNAPNTDGLDIDSSSYISINSCNFNVGDDCLCLKSGMDEDGYKVGKSCNNIIISNCHMNRGHGGIVIGSETAGGINDILIKNCTLSGTDRGIRIKTRRGRGGIIKNITIQDLKMISVICPIVINMYYKCGANKQNIKILSSLDEEYFNPLTTPIIKNIFISNIQAFNIKSASGFFYGLPESPIMNLKIDSFIATTDSNSQLITPAMDFFETKPTDSKFILKNVVNLKLESIILDGTQC